MSLEHTRAIVTAVLNGALDDVDTVADPNFGIEVPIHVPNVPDQVLNPRATWADKEAYDRQAAVLVDQFRKNFEKFADQASPEVIAAGPVAQ